MLRLVARVFTLLFLAATLAACAPRPKVVYRVPEVMEIRGAIVTANAGVSRNIARLLKQQLDKSIRSTHRPVPLRRAVMNVHLVNVIQFADLDGHGNRTQTEVSVTLTDVETGQPVSVQSYQIHSFALNQRSADFAAAETIAARLRAEYALAQPVLRGRPDYVPDTSTHLHGERPLRVKAVEEKPKPVVIPLKTVPVIDADQDPVLNSRTKVEPKAEPVKVEPALRKEEPKREEPKAAAVKAEPKLAEDGAKAKVVIAPKPAGNADEPCVETLDTKC